MKIPPVWVINLNRDPGRWKYISGHLDEFGVPYERIPAVDGQHLTDEQIGMYSEEKALHVIGRSLSRNEIGCALSHLNCYERIRQEGIDEVLILEDDLALEGEFWSVLENRGRFPVEYEHINFLSDTRQKPFGEPFYEQFRAATFYWRVPANRTAAYLITRQGAEKLLEIAYPLRMPADDLTGRIRLTGLRSYGVQPAVASLIPGPSSIWSPEDGSSVTRRYGRMAMFILRVRRNILTAIYMLWRRRQGD